MDTTSTTSWVSSSSSSEGRFKEVEYHSLNALCTLSLALQKESSCSLEVVLAHRIPQPFLQKKMVHVHTHTHMHIQSLMNLYNQTCFNMLQQHHVAIEDFEIYKGINK